MGGFVWVVLRKMLRWDGLISHDLFILDILINKCRARTQIFT
jgi:hypothetical protein